MSDKTTIANSALIKIGSKQSITSFEDGSVGANIASIRYDEIRKDLLRGHPWNFAISRVKLARLAGAPEFGYQYQFQLPVNWLRTLGVFLSRTGESYLRDYQAEGLQIHADAEEMWLRYVGDVTDENLMPPDFRECISYQLAMDMSIPIAGSNSIFQLMEGKLISQLMKAKSTDSMDDRPGRLPKGSWWGSRA